MAQNAERISDKVYWVGARDYSCRSFHGYYTARGVTYNSYLILGDEPIVIDGVKAEFAGEQLARIASVLPPEQIRHIVCNHSEFDHSGSIRTLAARSGAKVHALPAGVKQLTAMYGAMEYVPLTPSKPYTLGSETLTTYATPMVHWPDNAVTLYGDILFTNDAFGQHFASSNLLDTENDMAGVLAEAKKYYANIVMPYAAQAAKAVAAVKALSPAVIAPSHGVVLTEHIADMYALYDRLTSGQKEDKAVVVFDTMWGHTETLARTVGENLKTRFAEVRYFDLRVDPLSEAVTETADCALLAIGSPTHYLTVLPMIAAFMNELKSLKPSVPEYIAFGSYGWGGGAVKEINETMTALGYRHSETFTDVTKVF